MGDVDVVSITRQLTICQLPAGMGIASLGGPGKKEKKVGLAVMRVCIQVFVLWSV